MDRAIVRCAERTSMVSRLDTAADRNAITAFKPVIWSVPWSLVGKRRECMSDGGWCEPQAPSRSEPPRGGRKPRAYDFYPPPGGFYIQEGPGPPPQPLRLPYLPFSPPGHPPRPT